MRPDRVGGDPARRWLGYSVTLGHTVRVRVTALGGTAAAGLEGRIAYVGTSRVTDPDPHQALYDVRVTIDPASLLNAHVRLRVGMPMELFITTGSRSMLSYLTKPLANQFARAFRDNLRRRHDGERISIPIA